MIETPSTSMIVMVCDPVSDRHNQTGEIINMSFMGDKLCCLVQFKNKRWRSARAWHWPEQLVLAPAIERLALIEDK